METFSMDAATLTIQIINLLGLGLLGWLVYTLKNAVDAQKKTIDAQKTHIDSMASIVSTLDAPAMARRYKSYQEMVEAEKEAAIRAAERKFDEDKKALLESSGKAEDTLKLFAEMLDAQITEHAEAVGLLAVNFKFHSLEWELLKLSIPSKLRQRIEQAMSTMPMPLPPPPPPPVTLPELLTAPPDPNRRLSEAMAPLGKVKK
jgi:hypothetical protein